MSCATHDVLPVKGAPIRITTEPSSNWHPGASRSSDSVSVLAQVLDGGLHSLNVPYSYGFSIILLTILVKLGTFPLTRQQVCR